jgi:hypothetical protein
LRPNADVIEAMPPVTGDCRGVVSGYAQVNVGDLMGLK